MKSITPFSCLVINKRLRKCAFFIVDLKWLHLHFLLTELWVLHYLIMIQAGMRFTSVWWARRLRLCAWAISSRRMKSWSCSGSGLSSHAVDNCSVLRVIGRYDNGMHRIDKIRWYYINISIVLEYNYLYLFTIDIRSKYDAGRDDCKANWSDKTHLPWHCRTMWK